MSIRSIFRRARPTDSARQLYDAIVRQARQPVFYADCGVPDTVDGRFEMVALHTYLVLRRLKASAESTGAVAQELFDIMFDDMDIALREMGAGDMGVGKRVKAMIQAFYGRIAAYDGALALGAAELEEALVRNAYGTVEEPDPERVAHLARYMRDQDEHLARLDPERVASGDLEFREAI